MEEIQIILIKSKLPVTNQHLVSLVTQPREIPNLDRVLTIVWFTFYQPFWEKLSRIMLPWDRKLRLKTSGKLSCSSQKITVMVHFTMRLHESWWQRLNLSTEEKNMTTNILKVFQLRWQSLLKMGTHMIVDWSCSQVVTQLMKLSIWRTSWSTSSINWVNLD